MSCQVCLWANHPPCEKHIPCCDCHDDCINRQCLFGQSAPNLPKPKVKVCAQCGLELPLDDYYRYPAAKDGHRNICKHCYINRQQQKKFGEGYQAKHRTTLHKKNDDERKKYMNEYMRKYREANTAKVREICRKSIARKRAGEAKRKPGPPKGTKFKKQPVVEAPVIKGPRLCLQCVNYPCFDGIENLESDFAREGCHGFKKKEQ